MESAERPKGTLITGKELMREAKRDENFSRIRKQA